MSAVSETIVREYFELHDFLVRQRRKYIAQTRREEEDDVDFFVLNPRPLTESTRRPFLLTSADLPGIASAIVAVKGWHTGIFSTALLAKSPDIFRFVEPKFFQQAAKAFGQGVTPLKILIVPALPHETVARDQSIEFLRSKGIDAVIPFRTLLADLIAKTEANRNYQKSDVSQLIRILKNYDFFKDSQLELFKPKRKSRKNEAKP